MNFLRVTYSRYFQKISKSKVKPFSVVFVTLKFYMDGLINYLISGSPKYTQVLSCACKVHSEEFIFAKYTRNNSDNEFL